MATQVKKRESWGSRLGIIMAVAGSAGCFSIPLGNSPDVDRVDMLPPIRRTDHAKSTAFCARAQKKKQIRHFPQFSSVLISVINLLAASGLSYLFALWQKTGSLFVVKIHNNVIGMSEGTQNKLFASFPAIKITTSEDSRVDIFVFRKIIAARHGTIAVDFEYGQDTTFT